MTLELFEHNRKALDAAYASWEADNKRVAIVHAVGTGKSFIYHKLAEEQKGKRVLVLTPTNYIFQIQKSSVAKVDPKYNFNIYKTRTYVKNRDYAKYEPEELGQWDYIVLDEFHRAGARTWSKGVHALLDANPDARVLGLSATPIRYSDSGRDMLEELFDGNVVSTLLLPDAWAQGILQVPKYVLGDYQAEKTIAEAEKLLAKNKNPHRTAEMEQVLDQMRRAVVSSSMNLADIFADNVVDRAAKLVIFCRSSADLAIAWDKCFEWFSLVNTNIHRSKVLVSQFEDEEAERPEEQETNNKTILDSFNTDNDPDALKLLFCIDALNEGVHVDGVDGVILMRHTQSPIVFQQQIGRAISVTHNKQPLIIDLAGVLDDIKLIYNIQSDYRKIRSSRSGGYSDKTGDDFIIDNRIVEFAELNRRMHELYDMPRTLGEDIKDVFAWQTGVYQR